MMEYCPNCGAKDTVRRVKTKLDFNFKNEIITVDAEIYECSNCREQFDDAFESEKYVQEARRIYFEKHHLLKPEELKQFLDEYDLSYRDVEAITGIAFKTISRYVYGVIPDRSNSTLLKILKNYKNVFLDLVEENKQKLSTRKYKKLVNRLKTEIQKETNNDSKLNRAGEAKVNYGRQEKN
ncbi:MAG: hypothetical protein Kow00108_11330 [Calditrichia bacterium]